VGKEGGVSRLAVLTGLFLVLLLAVAAFYGELLYGATYMFASGVPAMAPLAVLFLLAAASPFIYRLLGWRVRRRELLAIYGMVLVAAPLVTHGILAWMLPIGIMQQYLARAIPDWETTFLL